MGWWVGYRIDDLEAWDKIKKGEYNMFSIEGQGQRIPVKKKKGCAKSFLEIYEHKRPKRGKIAKNFLEIYEQDDIIKGARSFLEVYLEKFNPYHDTKGRFSNRGGFVSFSPGNNPTQAQRSIDRENKYRQGEGISGTVGGAFGNAERMTHAQVRRRLEELKNKENKKTVDSSLNKEESKTIAKIEAKIRTFKNEQLHVVDEHGKDVFKKTGNSNSVSFTSEEAKVFEGKIITHNHPDVRYKEFNGTASYGGTFSFADVSVLTTTNAKQIRAVGTEGTYTLTQTSKSNPKEFNQFVKSNESEIQAKASAISKLIGKKYRDGKFDTYDEYLTENRKQTLSVLHDFYAESAPKYGYEYTFISFDGVKKMNNVLSDKNVIGKGNNVKEDNQDKTVIVLDKDLNDFLVKGIVKENCSNR